MNRDSSDFLRPALCDQARFDQYWLFANRSRKSRWNTCRSQESKLFIIRVVNGICYKKTRTVYLLNINFNNVNSRTRYRSITATKTLNHDISQHIHIKL